MGFMKKIGIIAGAVFTALLVLNACNNDKTEKTSKNYQAPKPEKVTPIINYTVIAKHPHDRTLYTEGFLFEKQQLFESTGAPEHLPQTFSAFGTVDLKTGKFDKKVEIDKKVYFGEGILFLKNKIYQLTYQNQVGFIYDPKTYNSLGQFGFTNKEGWGMTTEGEHLIFSDGTCNLTYMEPDNFKVVKTLAVVENGYGLYNLNELEYIKGYIYANVWMTNRIVKIDPKTGEVVGELNLDALNTETKTEDPNIGEMNGIAYDSISDKILITGKLWPKIYEIQFAH